MSAVDGCLCRCLCVCVCLSIGDGILLLVYIIYTKTLSAQILLTVFFWFVELGVIQLEVSRQLMKC